MGLAVTNLKILKKTLVDVSIAVVTEAILKNECLHSNQSFDGKYLWYKADKQQ